MDQQWIKTVFLTTYPKNYLLICFFLDQSEETLMRFMIPQHWLHKDNLFISCRDDHHVYQAQCVVTPQHTTARVAAYASIVTIKPNIEAVLHNRLPVMEFSSDRAHTGILAQYCPYFRASLMQLPHPSNYNQPKLIQLLFVCSVNCSINADDPLLILLPSPLSKISIEFSSVSPWG